MPRIVARKAFLLRTSPEILAALHRWAADEMRSVNGQVEYILRGALRKSGRLPARAMPTATERKPLAEEHASRSDAKLNRPGDADS